MKKNVVFMACVVNKDKSKNMGILIILIIQSKLGNTGVK